MAEKRKYRRINVNGKIDGRVVLASELEIINLSLGGVQFTSTKRVLTNSTCTINLKHKGKMISVEGKVVRSVFVGTKKRRMDSVPIYKVAMEFSNLPEAKKNILRQIIESFDT